MKFILMFLFQLFVTIIGIFLISFLMLFMEDFKPEHKQSQFKFQKRFKYLDSIFGNKEDGLGDKPYMERYNFNPTWWSIYNWYAWRNPIHNLALSMGVDDYITNYTWKGNRYTEDRVGREGFVYSIATGATGKKYKMYRWCKLWYKDYGIEMNIGYKNFNIQKVPKHYKYSFTFSINPFKKFEPRR